MPELDQNPPGNRRPRISVRSAHDREREPPAGLQYPPGLGQRRRRVPHQHVAIAAEHTVDARVGEIHPLGVEHPVVDVLEAELGPPSARCVHHRGREVGAEQPSVRPDHPRRREPGLTGTGGKLEHRLSGLGIERRHHPLPHRASDVPDVGPAAFPAGGHRLPDLVTGPSVLGEVHQRRDYRPARRRGQGTLPRAKRHNQRRGWDSNPRSRLTRDNGFQDRRIRPLCHPSGAARRKSLTPPRCVNYEGGACVTFGFRRPCR